MGNYSFEVPEDMRDIIGVLNAHGWNLTLRETGDAIEVLQDRAVVFTVTTRQEVEPFLAGLYLATTEWAPQR